MVRASGKSSAPASAGPSSGAGLQARGRAEAPDAQRLDQRHEAAAEHRSLDETLARVPARGAPRRAPPAQRVQQRSGDEVGLRPEARLRERRETATMASDPAARAARVRDQRRRGREPGAGEQQRMQRETARAAAVHREADPQEDGGVEDREHGERPSQAIAHGASGRSEREHAAEAGVSVGRREDPEPVERIRNREHRQSHRSAPGDAACGQRPGARAEVERAGEHEAGGAQREQVARARRGLPDLALPDRSRARRARGRRALQQGESPVRFHGAFMPLLMRAPSASTLQKMYWRMK